MKKLMYAMFLIFIGIFSVFTYTYFKSQNNNIGDDTYAFYQDNVSVNSIPLKESGYAFEKGECNNGATVTWDANEWSPTIDSMTKAKTKCNLYFKRSSVTDKIIEIAKTDTTNLAYDGTVEDSNLRYIGVNPNNYVTFNDELWRIIGVFKDIDDGSGNIEWRTKIIRNTSIGGKAWDTKGEYGLNDWITSSLNSELNGSYLNSLSIGAQGMISSTKWDINKTSYSNTPAMSYTQERGGAKWTGKIGLMHPSDYGYAVGGTSRSACLKNTMYNWDGNSVCPRNNWLFNNVDQWTITGCSDSGSSGVINVFEIGKVSGGSAFFTLAVRPTLYLSSNVMISGGSGTSTDPYILTQ